MITESDFIDLLKGFADHPAARGLQDDCAVLEFGAEKIIITHDAMAEGVHWLPGAAPEDIAWKLLAVNLSDLAAKGAEPLGVILSYSMLGSGWDAHFARGFGEALAHFGVPLLGGDTIGGATKTAKVAEGIFKQTLGLTAVGRATCPDVPSRSGCRAGDDLFVTGTLGNARAGFELVKKGLDEPADLVSAFLRPQPLLQKGRLLAPQVSAMMDISDGLFLDGKRMAEASGLALHIELSDIPLSASLIKHVSAGGKRDKNESDLAVKMQEYLSWGDDYQLLFAAPVGGSIPVAATRIGHFAFGEGLHLTQHGKPVQPRRLGFLHGEISG